MATTFEDIGTDAPSDLFSDPTTPTVEPKPATNEATPSSVKIENAIVNKNDSLDDLFPSVEPVQTQTEKRAPTQAEVAAQNPVDPASLDDPLALIGRARDDQFLAQRRAEIENGTKDFTIGDISAIEAMSYDEIYRRAAKADDVGQWLSDIIAGRSDDVVATNAINKKQRESVKAGNGNFVDKVWVPAQFSDLPIQDSEGLSIAREAFQGLTLEYGDELYAALTTSDDAAYEKAVDNYRRRVDNFRETAPVVSLMANILPSLAIGIATAGAGTAVSGGRAVAYGSKALLSKNALKAGAKAVAFGATENAIAGTGSREGVDRFDSASILSDAAIGGAFAGAIGGGISVAAHGLTSSSRIWNGLFNSKATSGVISSAEAESNAGLLLQKYLSESGVDMKQLQAKMMEGGSKPIIRILSEISDESTFAKLNDKILATNLNSKTKEDILNFLNTSVGDVADDFTYESQVLAMRILNTTDPAEIGSYLSDGIDTRLAPSMETANIVRNRLQELLADQPRAVRDEIIRDFKIDPNKVFDYEGLNNRIAKARLDRKQIGEQLGAARAKIADNDALDDSVLDTLRSFDREGDRVKKPSSAIQTLEEAINRSERLSKSPWKMRISERTGGGFRYEAKIIVKPDDWFVTQVSNDPDLVTKLGLPVGETGVIDIPENGVAVRFSDSQYELLSRDLKESFNEMLTRDAQERGLLDGFYSSRPELNAVSLDEARINGSEIRSAIDIFQKGTVQEGQTNANLLQNREAFSQIREGLNLADDGTTRTLSGRYRRIAGTTDAIEEINKVAKLIEEKGSGISEQDIYKSLTSASESAGGLELVMAKFFQDTKSFEDLTNIDDKTLYGLAKIRQLQGGASDVDHTVSRYKSIVESKKNVETKVSEILDLFGADPASDFSKRMTSLVRDIESGTVSGANIDIEFTKIQKELDNTVGLIQQLKTAIPDAANDTSGQTAAVLRSLENEAARLRQAQEDAIGESLRYHIVQTLNGADGSDIDKTLASFQNILRSEKATDALLGGTGVTKDTAIAALKAIRNVGTSLQILRKANTALDEHSFSLLGSSIKSLGIATANIGGTNSAVGRMLAYTTGRMIVTLGSSVRLHSNAVVLPKESKMILRLLKQSGDDEAVGRYFMPLFTNKPAKMSWSEFINKEIFSRATLRKALGQGFLVDQRQETR